MIEDTLDIIEDVAAVLAIAEGGKAYVLGYAVSRSPSKKIVLHPLSLAEAE